MIISEKSSKNNAQPIDNLRSNVDSDTDSWSRNYLIDVLKKYLATYVLEIGNDKGESVTSRKYYDLAFKLITCFSRVMLLMREVRRDYRLVNGYKKKACTHPDNYNFKVGSGNGGNNEIIELQLSPVLKQSRIVTSFVLYASKKTIELLLNHKYESKTVIFPVDIDKASFNWTKFTEDFETKLKNKGIGQEHITMLADSLDENWKKISDLLHKNNEDSDDSSDEGKKARSDSARPC